ncbi:MAG: hypothetical protein C0P79_012380 [Gammaproteobacteria bacterium]
MYDIRTLIRSFAAGEITPEMHGRVDHVKFQTGLALARNFITLPHGPAINRPGTRFIGQAKAAFPRLVPFYLTDGTGYLLEVGHQYIRFWYGGGQVLAAGSEVQITNWQWSGDGHTLTAASHGLANGTRVFLSGVTNNGQPVLTQGPFYVSDATTNTFRLRWGSPTGRYYNYKSNVLTWPYRDAFEGGVVTEATTQPYELATPYHANDLWSLRFSQTAGVMTITSHLYAPRELRIVSPSNWTLTEVAFTSPLDPPSSVTLTSPVAQGVTSDSMRQAYVVTAVDENGNESEPSALQQTQNNLWTAGNYNSIGWTSVAGAVRYHVYKAEGPAGTDWGFFGGWAFGLIGVTEGIAWVDNNIVPDFSRVPPENQSLFESAGDFPRVSTYFEQRRWFASTENQPQNVWATRSGSDSNMSRPIPPQEDSPLAFRIAADAAFAVQHMLSLDELLLFSDGGIWRVFAQDGGAISPFNVARRRIASIGASIQASPIVVDTRVLFVAAKSSHVIELTYTTSTDRVGYNVEDASLHAVHLFDGYKITHLAYSTQPYTIVWATRSDGVLLGMTYLPGQEVRGWHQHHTATSTGPSRVIDVAVVPEAGDVDGVYLLVARDFGSATKWFIERLELAKFDELADAFYVDCGLSYEGSSPATTFGGLDHLEGEPVVALADGIVVTDLVVEDGQVTLPFAATKVHIGLPIIADLQTLPLSYDSAISGNGVGTTKNVNKVRLRVNRSSHLLAGPSFDRLREFAQRTDEPMGSPPRLVTGVATIDIEPTWNEEGQVCVRQDMPLPVMISAIAQEVALGD